MDIKIIIGAIIVGLFCSGPASAIDVGAGVNFSTDNTVYEIADAFSCNDLVVYNDAFRINTGNISCDNTTKTILVLLQELDVTDTEIKFESNITIDTFTLTSGFDDFLIHDPDEYGIFYQTTLINYQYDDSSSSKIQFLNIPSDSWIITLSAETQSYTSDYFDPFFAANQTSWGMLGALINAYEDTVGASVFWGLFISMPWLAIWIKTKSVAIPSVIFLISGGVLLPLLPPAFDAPVRIMFALGIVGITFHVFIKRR